MNTIYEIVTDYIHSYRESAEKELHWFEIQRTFEQAIKIAAYAENPSGKRFSHQRRVPKAVLAESHRCLIECSPSLRKAKSFEDLYEIIFTQLQPIHGIGELTIYDTTLRIGAWLKLEPSVVFMHAGTRIGAKILGLDTSRGFVSMSELPPPLRKLRPREIEDVLCIYKDSLAQRLQRKRDHVRCWA